jgi:hypothetical protein
MKKKTKIFSKSEIDNFGNVIIKIIKINTDENGNPTASVITKKDIQGEKIPKTKFSSTYGTYDLKIT